MDFSTELVSVGDFAVALLIGALGGIDREKRKSEDGHGSIGLITEMAALGAATLLLV